jgi:hypothetical protein
MQVSAIRSAVSLVPVLLLSCSVSYCQTALTAGAGHFKIYQADKSVGDCNYTVRQTSNGYTVTSDGKLALSKFSYSFTNNQALDGNLNLVRDELSGNINGSAVTFNVASDSAGRQFQISISASGKQTQNTVDRHQHLVLLPDLDPAAYMLLVHVAMDKPQTSWVLIPKEDGILVPTSVTPGSALHGQLNGSQVEVQHATIAVNSENSINIELFYSSNGDVLEADLPQQNFSVIRDGFKLTDHPKSSAPPAPAQSSAKPTSSVHQYPTPQGGYPQMQQQ